MLSSSVSPQQMVLDLASRGMSDEQIAVHMGQALGTSNPSAQAIRRWRMGRGSPSRTFRDALIRVYKEIVSGA